MQTEKLNENPLASAKETLLRIGDRVLMVDPKSRGEKKNARSIEHGEWTALGVAAALTIFW